MKYYKTDFFLNTKFLTWNLSDAAALQGTEFCWSHLRL